MQGREEDCEEEERSVRKGRAVCGREEECGKEELEEECEEGKRSARCRRGMREVQVVRNSGSEKIRSQKENRSAPKKGGMS